MITARNSKVLRQKAKPVELDDLGTKKLGDIIAKMKKAVHAEDDGVAIAAPQVGVGLRIFLVKIKLSTLSTMSPLIWRGARR